MRGFSQSIAALPKFGPMRDELGVIQTLPFLKWIAKEKSNKFSNFCRKSNFSVKTPVNFTCIFNFQLSNFFRWFCGKNFDFCGGKFQICRWLISCLSNGTGFLLISFFKIWGQMPFWCQNHRKICRDSGNYLNMLRLTWNSGLKGFSVSAFICRIPQVPISTLS